MQETDLDLVQVLVQEEIGLLPDSSEVTTDRLPLQGPDSVMEMDPQEDPDLVMEMDPQADPDPEMEMDPQADPDLVMEMGQLADPDQEVEMEDKGLDFPQDLVPVLVQLPEGVRVGSEDKIL